jgi:(p)ppGpp synthase/HD superfamily hydrolase
MFGDDVAGVIEEVTDDKRLEKQERKRRQVVHSHQKSRRAKILKLADKTSNLRAIAASPPPGWSVKRRLEYVEWARDVAKGLTGVSPWLEREFERAAKDAERSTAFRHSE